MKIYMAVTPDEYELPLCVEESLQALGNHFSMTANAVNAAISRGTSGKLRGAKFIKIDIEDDYISR